MIFIFLRLNSYGAINGKAEYQNDRKDELKQIDTILIGKFILHPLKSLNLLIRIIISLIYQLFYLKIFIILLHLLIIDDFE